MANLILNGGTLDTLPLGWGTRQGYVLLPLLFNILLGVLVSAARQEKEINPIQIGKEGIKLYLLIDSISVYVESPKESPTKNFCEYSNIPSYKVKRIYLLLSHVPSVKN